ncbi:MAG: tyrosine--tRNA ligase [Bacillota bacterium]|jgi:tyrosyl-tRNA synthetase
MNKTLSLKQQLAILSGGAVEIIPKEGLVDKLARSIQSGQPLKVKLGLDPTAPDLHLGHTVVINKLKQFQDLGHVVQLVIGDFTGRIGDPTGRSEARQQLTEEAVQANARTYVEQYGKILDIERTELHFNSHWLAPLRFADVVRLAATYTLARMLEREDFTHRWQNNLPISLHEFFYPLMQGYDSVALQTDIEIGGTDQTFNLLVGRHLQRAYGQPEQVVMTFPLLEGLDGVQKMSKSLGNYVGISEPAEEMYGKVMSISDQLMLRYYQLVTDIAPPELQQLRQGLADGSVHPLEAKMRLAGQLVARYHGEEAALLAAEHFRTVFQQRELPEDMPTVVWKAGSQVAIIDLLSLTNLVGSKSEARRMVEQGAVRVDQHKVQDVHQSINVKNGTVVQVGRRKFAKLALSDCDSIDLG